MNLPLWIAAPLVAMAMNAQAQTLNPTPCTANRLCLNPAPTVGYLSAPTGATFFIVQVNGTEYESTLGSIMQGQVSWTNVYAYNGADSVLVSASFTHTVTHGSNGRPVQHWTLDSGSIVFP